MAITQVITAIPAAGHRGGDTQDIFVDKQEAFQDALTNITVTQLNTFATQANTLETNVNAKEATVVAKEALVSPHYTAIDTVAANIANVNNVASGIANVNAVGADLLEPISEINTVAANMVDINTVAINVVDINSIASTIVPNMVEILLADTNAATATTKATEALISATNAYNSELAAAALLDSFDDRYLGTKAIEPTLDNDGNPLLSGALYWNSALNTMKVYDLALTTWISLSFIPTDHSGLSGLTNDDHTQYHNDARGDVRYYTKLQSDTALGFKADQVTTYTKNEVDAIVVTSAPQAKLYFYGGF